LGREEVEAICEKYEGVSISALRPESLVKFFLALEKKVWEESDSTDDAYREISGKAWNAHRVRLTNVDSFDI